MGVLVTGNIELYNKICQCLGIDPGTVRRLVLDFNLDSPLTAYVEMYGDKRFLDVNWTEIKGIEIEMVDKEDKE